MIYCTITAIKRNVQNFFHFFTNVLGQNLLTVTKFNGLDPEMTVSDNALGDGDNAAGIDWGTYPSAVSYSMGLQITF